MIRFALTALAAAACLAAPARADFLTLNFAAVPGSAVVFDGNAQSFSFVNAAKGPAAGNNFAVTSTTTAAGDHLSGGSVGLFGAISGSFHINPATIVTTGTRQTAQVTTNNGMFTVRDGAGHDFTAKLNLTSITMDRNGGLIDAGVALNLSDFAYAGTNPDLVRLRDSLAGSLNLSFQFQIRKNGSLLAVDLTYLTTQGHKLATSYSGSLLAEEAVRTPLPGGLALAGSGLVLLAGVRAVRRKAGGR